MTMNAYLRMAHGVQALRRRVERNYALLGALGVAADPLPHQMANVARILEAPEMRYLLADGVGMGKTIQTLMILNALRLQDPDHRTLLVVPDHLISQWLQELGTRGHCDAAFVDDDAAVDEADVSVRIIKPSMLRSYLRYGSEYYDLLVVDEPQSLTIEQRDALARTRPFAQFLALTATPELGRPDMLQWFVAMLEPFRIATEEDPLAVIKQDEAVAAASIRSKDEARTAFERDALGRRICRWSRADWPDYMPRRDYTRANVPTFAREASLATTARKVLAGNVGSDPNSRARALHRLGRASREALAALPDGIHQIPDGADAMVGDSRLDALLDYLAMIRAEKSDARVLVVAGDNDTVARLRRILPAYLQNSDEDKQTNIARLARGEQTAVDTEEAIRRNVDTIGEFVSGSNDILLLGDWAEAGLNLHHGCETLVFYSCPWTVRSIDQLVGRLDRLRQGAALAAEARKDQGCVRIHTITWAGSPEADVVDGLERLGVFERPIPPMSVERVETVERYLGALAAGREIQASLAELELMGGDGTGELATSRLARSDPHKVGAARARHRAMLERKSLPGALQPTRKEYGARGPEEAELFAWLEALRASNLLDVRTGLNDPSVAGAHYGSAWYADIGVKNSGAAHDFSLELFERQNEGDRRANPRSGQVAFLHHRRHLSDPPLRVATDQRGETRRLNFIDHGDEFHEQLCTTFLNLADTALGREQVAVKSVGYPSGHSVLSDPRPLLVTAAACSLLLSAEGDAHWDELIDGLNVRDARHLRRYARAALQADERWLRLAAPPWLFLEGLAINPETNKLERLEMSHVTTVLDPRSEAGSLIVRDPKPLPNTVQRLRKAAVGRRVKAHGTEPRRPDQGQVARRAEIVTAEADRMQKAAQSRAVTFRGQMSTDERQARIAEARAKRVEREAEALSLLTSRRLKRIADEKKIIDTRVWQLILIPFERT